MIVLRLAPHLVAISLAAIAAWFSIRGMIVLFPGAPVIYAAQLLGGTTEQAICWLILAMVPCCDPRASALTAAVSARG